MYFAVVAITMLVAPVASIVLERALVPDAAWLLLLGKWFVFWGVGARLGLAGLRQMLNPGFTAREIFHIGDDAALPVVRELGAWNLAIGLLGLASLAKPDFVLPVALAAAFFYAAAGMGHVREDNRTAKENVAMVSDLFMAAVLAIAALGAV